MPEQIIKPPGSVAGNADELVPFSAAIADRQSVVRSKVKIGLVGLNFGKFIIDELLSKPASDFFDLTALCDLDSQRMAEAAGKVSASCYENLDDLLADPNVEAVGLFTKPGGRAKLIQKIIRTGRHVVTTKPLEADSDAALAVLHEARELGILVHCNSPSPSPTDDLKLIKQWEEKHHLGHPIAARGDIWVSYRELPDGSWYDDVVNCPAAPLYRLGIYLINDLLRLWGGVERVHMMQSRIFTKRPTADNAQVGLLFKNKAIANIFASFCIKDGDSYRNSLILNYENGTVYRNAGPAWSAQEEKRCRLTLVQEREERRKVIDETFVNTSSGGYQWQDFARAVRGDLLLNELTPEEMVEGIRVIQAIMAAERDSGVADVAR